MATIKTMYKCSFCETMRENINEMTLLVWGEDTLTIYAPTPAAKARIVIMPRAALEKAEYMFACSAKCCTVAVQRHQDGKQIGVTPWTRLPL